MSDIKKIDASEVELIKETFGSLTIGEAYTLAWSACENPELDSENPHFGNRFASLAATLRVIREACAKYGIIYEQHEVDGWLLSRVRMGEQILDLSKMKLFEREDPQKHGIQLTYKKRQMAQADWGIVGEEDTDGEGDQPQQVAHDYTELTQLAEEFAEIMGISVSEAKKTIIGVHGNPKTMTEEEYALYITRVRADVSSARAAKEEAVND